MEKWPEDPPGKSYALVSWLDRHGDAIRPRGDEGLGQPRPPKQRAIDLRVGDQVLLHGRWATITEVLAYRHRWLTVEQAARNDHQGYLYELPAISPP